MAVLRGDRAPSAAKRDGSNATNATRRPKAVTLGKRGRPKKGEEKVGITNISKGGSKRGRPKKGEGKPCNASFKYGTRDHWLARLDRDETFSPR